MNVADRKERNRTAMAAIGLVEALLREWDPIGVEPGTVAPLDEYDSYAPTIVSMVTGGCAVDGLAAHLEHIATAHMGLKRSTPESQAHSLNAAAKMIRALRPSN